ncbi:hypothetical protein WJX74_003342 [Apatococcus lobatus]|uniref:K Homology domain-containing protein n=1 Tax=Apatococcus lobatus TaxID=904363 RepID=A0AAW1RGR3_9CHLO
MFSGESKGRMAHDRALLPKKLLSKFDDCTAPAAGPAPIHGVELPQSHRRGGSIPYSHVRQGSETSPMVPEAVGCTSQQQTVPSLEGMLNFITSNKITEGRPIRSKLADSSGSRTAVGMKWIQPSGPRKTGQGVEDEEQGIISADQTPSGGAVLRITLLAAGFVIGPSGSSVRQIMAQTGAEIKSWTDHAKSSSSRSSRIFVVEGDWQCAVAALKVVYEAVDRYKELCEGKYCGQHVHRSQIVSGVEFSYQPPPRHLVPYAAALKGQGSRMRQGEGRDMQAAYAADIFADVRSALNAQQSFCASQASALQQPTPAAPRPSSAKDAAAAVGGTSSSVRRALYGDTSTTSSSQPHQSSTPIPARHDKLYALKQADSTGMDMSTLQDASQQDQTHSTMTNDDRWGATGMGPLATVAHVLAANNRSSLTDQFNIPTVRINPHSQPLQSSSSQTAAVPTGAAGHSDMPHQAASAAGSGIQTTHLPNPHMSSAFSAYNPYQALPQRSEIRAQSSYRQASQALPAGNPYQQYENAASMAVAPSLESSLGSGVIPAYFDPPAEGLPDLPVGPALDAHTGRFLTSNGNFSTRSSGNISGHSVQSGSNSLENMRAAAKTDHGPNEAPDADMTMVHDAPCAPPSTHHNGTTAVGTHSAPPSATHIGQNGSQFGHSAVGVGAKPPANLLSTAFGSLAVDSGSMPMDTGIAEDINQHQCNLIQPTEPRSGPPSWTFSSGGSVAAFGGSRFSSGSDLAQHSTSSPASFLQKPVSQNQSLTLGEFNQSQQLHKQFLSNASAHSHRNDPSREGYPAHEHQEDGASLIGRALSPALDVEMLRSIRLNLDDLMDDGGYSWARAAEARRMRLVAEGPKPRQTRMPLSPRSIAGHGFSAGTASGGTFSGGSAHNSGRSRLSMGAQADGSSLWSRPVVSSPLDSPQYFLPSNLEEWLSQAENPTPSHATEYNQNAQ